MRKSLLAAVLVLCSASVAYAQEGDETVRVYADEQDINDPPPGCSSGHPVGKQWDPSCPADMPGCEPIMVEWNCPGGTSGGGCSIAAGVS